MTADDIKELEKILWNDLGTKADYEADRGSSVSGLENDIIRPAIADIQ